MPAETKRVFTSVFSKLKQKVLWKWETEDMEGKPANVMLKKWLPQQDVLGERSNCSFLLADLCRHQ
jgi:glucuronosyltransferase